MRVQVISESEILRIEKIRRDEDECCMKIKLCCCLSVCISGTIYLIVMIIVIYVHMVNLESLEDSIRFRHESNDTLGD